MPSPQYHLFPYRNAQIIFTTLYTSLTISCQRYFQLKSLTYSLDLPISSMKRIVGAPSLARWNNSPILFSASPTYGEQMSAAETDRNVTFRAPASAQANDVLAHPGGPYSKTPEKNRHGHIVNNRLLSQIHNCNLTLCSFSVL